MRTVYLSEELEQIEFAKRAAKCFQENAKFRSYTDGGEIQPGGLLALRWGLGDDCVLVLKLDEAHVPVNYQQLAKAVT